ncbi:MULTISPECIES: hypothetical protein [Streptomyces]|uniref:hypothetical protein n=1 Tax=Streptomyces TaxID=1883 RepID=UPI001EEF9B39|nr:MULTISPECIES: hypothetical protein [Streptomyces]
MAGTALAPGKVRVKTSEKRGHRSRIALVNAVPVTVFLLVLFVYPIIGVLSLSLKGDTGGFTLHWYTDALSGVNLSVLISTLRISAETAVLSAPGGVCAGARHRPDAARLRRPGHADRGRAALHQRPGAHLRLDHHAR